MSRHFVLWAVGLLFSFGSLSANAETVEEILSLAKKGVGEEVQLAAVERSKSGFSLTTDQIIQLKKSGVSEKVIAAMLRKKAESAPAQGVNKVDEAAPAVGDGILNIENTDEKPWGYRFDTEARILWITESTAARSHVLNPHGGLSLKAPAGEYQVRYAGEGESRKFTIKASKKQLIMLSRVETTEFEGLYVSMFMDGERKNGGRLATLRHTKKGGQPKASYRYVEPERKTVTRERVIERERVVVRPSTTVIYRTPAVYSYPYYRYHYSHPCGVYYPSHFGVGYHHWGRRSGWSVGVGFGF